MKLFILRHAKTEQVSSTGKDFDRKLKEKGINQCALLEAFFRENYSDTSFVVHCSAARRTKATFTRVKKALDVTTVHYSEDLYLVYLDGLKNYLSSVPKTDEELLIIGHNSGLSDLVSYLTGNSFLLPTSGLVVLDLNVGDFKAVSAGCASLVDEYYPSPN